MACLELFPLDRRGDDGAQSHDHWHPNLGVQVGGSEYDTLGYHYQRVLRLGPHVLCLPGITLQTGPKPLETLVVILI